MTVYWNTLVTFMFFNVALSSATRRQIYLVTPISTPAKMEEPISTFMD